MRIHRTLMACLALALATTATHADSLVYIVNGSQQFGTIDLATGAFNQIGPLQPEAGSFGLATAPNGSLVTFAYSGNLYSINPTTGAPALSGLGGCPPSASSCAPTTASTLGNYAGNIYATDFQNSLYSINPLTGAATLIGPTGIPAIPFVPGSMNPDGTFNLYDEAIFGRKRKYLHNLRCLCHRLQHLLDHQCPCRSRAVQGQSPNRSCNPSRPHRSGHRRRHRHQRRLLRIQRPGECSDHAQSHQRQHQLRNQLRFRCRSGPGSSPGPHPHPRALIPHSFGNSSARPWRHRSQKTPMNAQ